MRRVIGMTVAAVTVIAVLAGALSASQIVVLEPREMADHSELVLAGRVTAIESYWNEDRTKIFTKTTVRVDKTYKGPGSQYVDLIQLGGTVGNVKVSVEGGLKWAVDEEVLLFLEPYGPTSLYQVAGLFQGRFDIERDPETGERFVRRPGVEGLKLIQGDGTGFRGDGSIERVPLEQFISEVLE